MNGGYCKHWNISLDFTVTRVLGWEISPSISYALKISLHSKSKSSAPIVSFAPTPRLRIRNRTRVTSSIFSAKWKEQKKGSVYNIRRQDWHTKMKITSPPVALESVETALSGPFSFLPADRSWKTKSSPITSWISRPAVRIHPSHSTDRRLRSLKSISACSSPWSRRS